jgi:hypothetical protein
VDAGGRRVAAACLLTDSQMITTPTPRIDIGSLNLGDTLGSGGQGRVTAISGFLINDQWAAALKTYSSDVTDHLDAGVLETIVGFPAQLAPHDLRWLHENTAWPAAVAEDTGTVCGFLMRTVPAAYYFDFQTQTQGTRRKPADMAFLLNTDDYVRRSGLAVSEQDRFALLGSLAAALSRLHALDVVIGDFSPKNMLFALKPMPSCFLIDCDAVRLHGQTVLDQTDTPDWEIPDSEPKATPATDAYKFGLLAIRLFARDQSSYDRRPLAAISPELGRLAELSQHSNPAQRPAPGTWIAALDAAAFSASPATATATSVPAAMKPSRISVPIPTVSQSTGQPTRAAAPAAAPAAPPRRGRAATLIAACVIVLLVIVVAVHVASQPSGSAGSSAGSAGSSAGSAGSGTSGTSGSSASDQAAQVNRLLVESAATRRLLARAVADVGACSNLPVAASELRQVVDQRRRELGRASALSTNALPGADELSTELSQAMSYSLRADRHFLAWARQQLNAGCIAPAPQTSAYQAGVTASEQARASKTGFLRLWNPVATNQGLQTWTQAQI